MTRLSPSHSGYRSPLINVMVQAVEKASKGLIRDFGELEQLQVSRKSLGDFVSSADRRSEQTLIEELERVRPAIGFIAEESGTHIGKDPTQHWIIDPLDGTTNFLHGIPQFAINLALKHHDEIIAAVTFDPIKDELFWAEKGRGVYLNRRRIRVSSRRILDEALVGIGAPYGHFGDPVLFQKRIGKFLSKVSGVRRLGAASLDLAYVACGRFDVFFEEPMKIWDYAAGLLFIQEAGGKITTINGMANIFEQNSILAGNPDMHASFLSILNTP